jgi:rhamnogalacturonyl hydrolase YesR
MKSIQTFAFLLIILFVSNSCSAPEKNTGHDFITEQVAFAAGQYQLHTSLIEASGKVLNPKTILNGKIRYIKPEEWTSGFFPGSMWYLYELTGDQRWQELGIKYTEALDTVKYLTWHHDVGFMIGCSFGNALRLSGDEAYKAVIVEAARSLSSRFRPAAGILQSWNVDRGWMSERGWECPVIIDNMMNLELLFDATEYTGDSSFYHLAVQHADRTIEQQFRPDYSTWHVIDYNLTDGSR